MFFTKKWLLNDWEKIRTKGQLRFVVAYGVLGWGVSTAVVSILLMWLFAPSVSLKSFSTLALGLFPMFGVILGIDLWRRCERDYFSKRN